MDSGQRRNLIIEFVSIHQGCLAQKIVDGLRSKMSRSLVFKHLGELVKDGTIEDNKLNRRDHRYFVNKNSPVLLLTQELDGFENAIVALLQYARDAYDKGYSSAIKTQDWPALGRVDRIKGSITSLTVWFFAHIVNTYSTRGLFKWPIEIRDKELLEKMYATLFAKLNQIVSHLSGLIEWARLYEGEDMKKRLMYEFDFTRMLSIKDYLADVGLGTNKYEAVMESVWKISSPILPERVKHMGWKKALENSRETGTL